MPLPVCLSLGPEGPRFGSRAGSRFTQGRVGAFLMNGDPLKGESQAAFRLFMAILPSEQCGKSYLGKTILVFSSIPLVPPFLFPVLPLVCCLVVFILRSAGVGDLLIFLNITCCAFLWWRRGPSSWGIVKRGLTKGESLCVIL